MRDPMTPPTMATATRARSEPPFRAGAPNVVVIVLRRSRLRAARLLRLGPAHAEPGPAGRAWVALHELPHHGGVLADARVSADRPQSSPGRDGHAARSADELPRRTRVASRRRRERSRRSCGPRATRRSAWASGISFRAISGSRARTTCGRPGSASTATTDSSTARPTSGRRISCATRTMSSHRRARRRLSPRRRPRRQRDRLPARAAHLAPRPAVPALVRIGRSARAAPSAAGVDRPVPRSVRRRLGRLARGNACPADRARHPPGGHAAARNARRGSRTGRRSTRRAVGCTRG